MIMTTRILQAKGQETVVLLLFLPCHATATAATVLLLLLLCVRS